MGRSTRSSRQPSELSLWYTSLPPPRNEAASTQRVTLSLVAVEVTSPDTIVAATGRQSRRSMQPISLVKCEGPTYEVLKGKPFDLSIDFEPYQDESGYHLPGAVDSIGPPSRFYVGYQDTDALSTRAQTISNTDVSITVKGGWCHGLEANSWDILNLYRIELSKIRIYSYGHYYLHLIIEQESHHGAPEVLAEVVTRMIKVL
ncbi:hypothetical protein F4781DRAFT_442301 [Annulohypoxylon bovei var. microspora]|nr:hypothetical protein F4781DRAFT_442301 [Annulohypoxylon bovei var. microspora]